VPPSPRGAGERGASRWGIVAIVVVSVAVAVTVTALVTRSAYNSGKKAGREAGGSNVTIKPGKVTGLAAELVALVEKGPHAVYHARYDVSSAQTVSQKASFTLEVWRKEGLYRQDSTISTSGVVNHASTFQTSEGIVSCRATGGGPWSCQKVPGSGAGSLDEQLSKVTAQLAGAKVTARDDTIAGVAVRCFTIDLPSITTDTDVCLTHDGVPARQIAGDNKLNLITLDTTVGDVFTPPAPVTA